MDATGKEKTDLSREDLQTDVWKSTNHGVARFHFARLAAEPFILPSFFLQSSNYTAVSL